jgi:hypothetical protein
LVLEGRGFFMRALWRGINSRSTERTFARNKNNAKTTLAEKRTTPSQVPKKQ